MDSIIEKIELLFESSPLLGLKIDENIKLENQYELISNISYFDFGINPNWEIIASRLSPFFDCVILCQNSHIYSLYFQNQKIEHPIWAVNIVWPKSDYLSVLKADTGPFMKKIFEEKIFNPKKHSTFLVNLGIQHHQESRHELRMVLVSSTAEPWLSVKIQTLRSALEKLTFSDTPTMTE